MRRTLESLLESMVHGRLQRPETFDPISDALNYFLPDPGVIRLEIKSVSEIENLVTTIARYEYGQIINRRQLLSSEHRLANPLHLVEFFESVRRTFLDLSRSWFHLLFDDAGVPYVPKMIQFVINTLMITSNSLYCVKLSAEKLTYTFRTVDGKVLENGHNYYEYDISYSLFLGEGTTGIGRDKLEGYFRAIIEKRLRGGCPILC